MRFSRQILGVTALAGAMVLPTLAWADGLTGTYRGNVTLLFFDSHIEREGLVVQLNEQDGRLAGTAGPSVEQQSPVANLSVGRQMQFDTDANGSRPLHYNLSRYGAEWRGDVIGKAEGHDVMGRARLLRDPN